MIETKQMQRSVDRQERQLFTEADSSFPSASCRDRQRNHNLTQLRRTIRPTQSIKVSVERQHVSRRILTPKSPIQRSHGARIRHSDRHDTRYP